MTEQELYNLKFGDKIVGPHGEGKFVCVSRDIYDVDYTVYHIIEGGIERELKIPKSLFMDNFLLPPKKAAAKALLSNNKKYLRVQNFNCDYSSTYVQISNITRVSHDLDGHCLIFTSDSGYALVCAQTYDEVIGILEDL